MKKKNVLLIIFVMISILGFSQSKENSIIIYIGKLKCEDKVKISRSKLLEEAKLTIIANGKDTINDVSFTMQSLLGEDLTPKFISKSTKFTPEMNRIINKEVLGEMTKNIWIENITVSYKGESIKLQSIAVAIND